MPQMMAFLPLITAVAGPLLSKAMGGGGSSGKEKSAPAQQIQSAQPAVKNLFSSPEQIKQATDQYTQQGTAKWNQILAGMGAGGGTGGPDVATQIGNQASQLGTRLGMLNSDSGYGSDPMANLDAIMKGVEGGISPKYSVY
jgi:Mrp family chromosome partitioning ATPase